MHVLIAGCGDLGNVLARLLLQKGHTVFGLKRNTSTLPDGVHAIAADLTQPASLKNLPASLDQLVFMPTPAHRTQEAYSEIFIQGWNNLWKALPSPPERSLLVSSTAVYGQVDGSWVNELTDAQPAKFNGQVLLEMENLAKATGTEVMIARLSGIYGPGRERLIRMAASGEPLKNAGNGFGNRVHLDDAGAALTHLLSLEHPQDLYLVSDDEPVAKYEVISWLAQQLGQSPPTTGPQADIDLGKRVSNKRLRDSGFKFLYPDYRAGYEAIVKKRNHHEFSG